MPGKVEVEGTRPLQRGSQSPLNCNRSTTGKGDLMDDMLHVLNLQLVEKLSDRLRTCCPNQLTKILFADKEITNMFNR